MYNILFIGRASVFMTPYFLCMQIITFPKSLQLVVLLTLAQMITFFLLYKNDAYKIVSKWK